ncbi:hypothetical protein AALP_AA1G053500 [Arabis alpina]|uniref:Uncharacterized protein n=1 Tax=Arabis alpina TaxID=50452 RepID=A0A087HLA3_ARAAL|nr:hypothetical protein AALP_AA1G053500 [Arabis alpina]
MEKTTMKTNESRPSLSSLRSSFCTTFGLTDIFLALARELRPELFSSFQAKNMTSTEMAMSLFPRLTEDIGMNNKEPVKTLLLPD